MGEYSNQWSCLSHSSIILHLLGYLFVSLSLYVCLYVCLSVCLSLTVHLVSLILPLIPRTSTPSKANDPCIFCSLTLHLKLSHYFRSIDPFPHYILHFSLFSCF